MDTLIQILTYLFPAGVGSFITWIFARDVYQAKKRKEVHDIYQEMYNDVSVTLANIQDENKKLHRAVARLEKAVRLATMCRHWPDCPMRDELPEPERVDTEKQQRQPATKKRARADPGTRAHEPGDDGDTAAGHEDAPC